jgi:hypothetical protein
MIYNLQYDYKLLYVIKMEYIYRISFYDTKRSRSSHTDMYYLKPEHTQWAFNQYQITKIFYIKVPINSNEYDSAVKNSMIMDTEHICHCNTNLEEPK